MFLKKQFQRRITRKIKKTMIKNKEEDICIEIKLSVHVEAQLMEASRKKSSFNRQPESTMITYFDLAIEQ